MSFIQKRLHISGLVSSISEKDLLSRLQVFGKVLALDGFGVLDAVGRPRRFAYVTLEATEANLARCLNLLSGTTWKGTKLRIGEAKPDYAHRLDQERKRAPEEQKETTLKRKKLLKGIEGIHSKDMSIVTPQNAHARSGWHVTALSHLIRPMKMRPMRPFETPFATNGAEPLKKRRKRDLTDVPVRARITTIDPRLYGATHLRGNMLDSVIIVPPMPASYPASVPLVMAPEIISAPTKQRRSKTPLPVSLHSPSEESPNIHSSNEANVEMSNVEEEKTRHLDLLHEMFKDTEWGGRNNVDKEYEREATVSVEESNIEDAHDVSADKLEIQETPPAPPPQAPITQKKTEQASLRDMFKPQEEKAFSLLANLEFEMDSAFNFKDSEHITAATAIEHVSLEKPPMRAETFALDTSLPLFFPQPDDPRAHDIFSVARAEGWAFGRDGDVLSIRKRWDEKKGALTKEWKKRAREAQKSRRRRYGTAQGEDA